MHAILSMCIAQRASYLATAWAAEGCLDKFAIYYAVQLLQKPEVLFWAQRRCTGLHIAHSSSKHDARLNSRLAMCVVKQVDRF